MRLLRSDVQFRDTTAADRIMAKVAEMLNSGGLAFNDTTVATATKIGQPKDELMRDAQEHGESGYITAVDDSNRTLWVFFYADAEECNRILTHIRKDIFVYNRQQLME